MAACGLPPGERGRISGEEYWSGVKRRAEPPEIEAVREEFAGPGRDQRAQRIGFFRSCFDLVEHRVPRRHRGGVKAIFAVVHRRDEDVAFFAEFDHRVNRRRRG